MCVATKSVDDEGLWIESIIEQTKQSRREGRRTAAAAEALSEQDGSAKSAVDRISEEAIRQIGED